MAGPGVAGRERLVLTLPASVRIYVAAEAVDLRRGFDGLAAATRSLIRQDPLSGHVFAFINRRGNRIKLLVWDRTGYVLLYNDRDPGQDPPLDHCHARRRVRGWRARWLTSSISGRHSASSSATVT